MGLHDRLHEIIEPIVTELGLELFDLNYAGSTLSVMIDRPRPTAPTGTPEEPGTRTSPTPPDDPGVAGDRRSGVDMAAITTVTRAVSRALDEHDPIPSHFSLEVSSPGLERPLRTPVHFARAVGEVVSIKTIAGAELPRRIKGVLLRAGAGRRDQAVDGDDRVGDGELPRTIAVRSEPGAEVLTIPYDEIEKARTVFEWGPEPKSKPSKTNKPTKPGKAQAGKPRTSGSPSPSAPETPPNLPADDKKVTAT